jgi:hypothetical protein
MENGKGKTANEKVLKFQVKGCAVSVDITKMTQETIEKVLLKGLSRTVFERETGKGDEERLPLAVASIAENPEKYFSNIKIKSEGTSDFDREIISLLRKYIEAKGLIPADIPGKKFPEKWKNFQGTKIYSELLEKARKNKGFIAKATENVAKKEEQRKKKAAEKQTLNEMTL